MDKTADKNFFSFRMLLIVFYWITGTILMVLSVYSDVSVFWGLAVVVAGTILLIVGVVAKDNNCK